MNKEAMYKLSYGLFVLTAKEGKKDNGCIINTAIQAASAPNQLSICINKANATHDMIVNTGKFTVSVLSQVADLSCLNGSVFSPAGMWTSLKDTKPADAAKMEFIM